MSEISPREFLENLKKSGLIERNVLKASLAGLSARSGGEPVKLKQLASWLIDTGLITEWQRDKLLDGKFKGFTLGPYSLLKLLGAGGMSTVYLAEHKLGGHRRAIKVLPKQRAADRSYLDRFYREGRAAAALNHPNIVRIYDLACEDDIHYMVMEFVEGIDLQELVKRDGPLSVDLALEYLKQAATGLRHAHERKIVHRDVKPSNLLATQDGRIKVLDLGLALMRDTGESLTLMHNDRVMGTADYLSPEQAIDSHEVDPLADIYSLGCTLHFLLTGKPPFPDGSIAQRIAMHASREAPLISSLNPACPEAVAQLAHSMMRKKKEDRLQSCRELIHEIRAIQAGLSAESGSVRPTALPKAVPATLPESVANSPALPGPVPNAVPSAMVASPLRAAASGAAGTGVAPGVPKDIHRKSREQREVSAGPGTASADPGAPLIAAVAVAPIQKQTAAPHPAKAEATGTNRSNPESAGTRAVNVPPIQPAAESRSGRPTPPQVAVPAPPRPSPIPGETGKSPASPRGDRTAAQPGKPDARRIEPILAPAADRGAPDLASLKIDVPQVLPEAAGLAGLGQLAPVDFGTHKRIQNRRGKVRGRSGIWIGIVVGLMFVSLLVVLAIALRWVQ